MSIDKKQLSKLLSYMATFDGGIYESHKRKKDSKVNCMFIMNMRKENLDYVQWVADTISNLTGYNIYDRKDYNTDGYKREPQVRLQSNRHPYLTKLRNRLYINNHKVIDPHMLTMMDAEALAIIFMCDGGSYLDTRPKTPHANIKLHTKGFSYADNMALSKAIYSSVGIRTNVNKHYNYYMLSVKSADINKFIDVVTPHVLPSFMYKLERIAPTK